jgi:hypothetical protein
MGSSTSEIARVDPYAPTQPGIKAGLKDARRLYERGGFKTTPYRGDMVANMTRNQLAALQATRDAVPGQLANIQGAQDTVRGMQNQSMYGGLNTSIGNMQGAQETGDLRQGITAAQNQAYDPRFGGITGADRGNDARFDATINRETDPGQAMQMQDALRRNVIEGIAPQISGAFSKSGMANSGLHAQNLAKGLASGLAPIEYQMANDSRERALRAAGMGQSAYESGKQFDLSAGGMRQSALESGRDRSLQAGQVSESATRDRLSEALRAGQAGQTAMDTNESQAMQAAGMMPGLNEAYYNPIDRQRDAGQYQQIQKQNEINARILRQQQRQTSSADAIERYLSLVSGVGANFPNQRTTQTQNPGLLGMLGTGLQVLPFLGGAPSGGIIYD